MGKPTTRSRNLREDCMREALAIIEEAGVEALSLRDVARRLNVSHQAPYKHFPSRDHLLAEIVGRAFTAFARHLDARPRGDGPREDLAAMGRAYLRYATEHPLQYRLMFGTPLPDPDLHPEMMRRAQHAFSLLRDGLARIAAEQGPPDGPEGAAELDALFVWATMHGLASILHSHALDTLGLSGSVLADAVPHALRRIGAAFPSPAAGVGDSTHLRPPRFEEGEP